MSFSSPNLQICNTAENSQKLLYVCTSLRSESLNVLLILWSKFREVWIFFKFCLIVCFTSDQHTLHSILGHTCHWVSINYPWHRTPLLQATYEVILHLSGIWWHKKLSLVYETARSFFSYTRGLYTGTSLRGILSGIQVIMQSINKII